MVDSEVVNLEIPRFFAFGGVHLYMTNTQKRTAILPLLLTTAAEQARIFCLKRYGNADYASPHLHAVEKLVWLTCSTENRWGIDFDGIRPTDTLAQIGTKGNIAAYARTLIWREMSRSVKRAKKLDARLSYPEEFDPSDKYRPYVAPETVMESLHTFCADRTEDTIIDLLASGLSRAEVARDLGISESKISRRLAAIDARRREDTPAIRALSERPGGEIVSLSLARGRDHLVMIRAVDHHAGCFNLGNLRRVWDVPKLAPQRASVVERNKSRKTCQVVCKT